MAERKRADAALDVPEGHHSGIRPHPPTFAFLNNHRYKSHFRLRSRSPRFRGIRGVSWYPSWSITGVMVSVARLLARLILFKGDQRGHSDP